MCQPKSQSDLGFLTALGLGLELSLGGLGLKLKLVPTYTLLIPAINNYVCMLNNTEDNIMTDK